MLAGTPLSLCRRCQAPTSLACFCWRWPGVASETTSQATGGGVQTHYEADKSSNFDTETRQAPTAVLALPFDLASVTISAQNVYESVASVSPTVLISAPMVTTTRDFAPASPFDREDRYQLAKYSVFSERATSRRSMLKRQRKEANYLRKSALVRKLARVVVGPNFDVGTASTPPRKRAGMEGSRIILPKASNGSQIRGAKGRASAATLSSTDFQASGIVESSRIQQVEAALTASSPSLAGFTFSHRTRIPGQATSFVDASRRSFATRVECPDSMSTLAADLSENVDAAVRPGKGSISVMPTDSSRGPHEVRQIGVHREQGAGLGYSGAFKKGAFKWTSLMDGVGLRRARGHISRCLQTHYPQLYDYHRTLAQSLAVVGLYFLFGAFASFCLNTGGNVVCHPHRDTHNLGPGLCGILPWGQFDSTRSAWIVLEEARLVVEVAPGDIFFFPSAIFTHWNTPLVGRDRRNSLAFWTGATLFLWAESGGRAFNTLPKDERNAKLARTKESWNEAWKRFPVL